VPLRSSVDILQQDRFQRQARCKIFRKILVTIDQSVPHPLCCVLLVPLVLPRLTACLVVYQHARLDSVTIPEYFAPPGVFCACLCEESEAVEISSGGDSYDGDWCPSTHLGCGSYRQAVTLFTEEPDFLSDINKTWIMGRGIAEWLGWPL